MQARSAVRAVAVAVILAMSLVSESPSIAAQGAPPPDLGPVVVEDALAQRGVIDRGGCPTGTNTNRFTPDGYRLTVTGNCFADRPSPFTFQRTNRLSVPDGEVQFEARAATDLGRIQFGLGFRVQQNFDRYAAMFEPGNGKAQLVRTVGEQTTVLAERSDLDQIAVDWTKVGVRAQGSTFWLLIDGQPALTATDSAYADGFIFFGFTRLGDPGDKQESAVLIRNLRVSRLAAGDMARAPKYEPFPTPPPLGDVILDDPLTQPGVATRVNCPTGLAAGEFVGEGYLFKVRGRCTQPNGSADVPQRLQGLTVPDGEVKIELRVVNGANRVRFFLQVRRQLNEPDNDYLAVEPVSNLLHLLKIKGGNPAVVLDQQNNLAEYFKADGWNTIAVRLQGSSLWVLVNDEPILAATDPELAESGGIGVQLRRIGSLDDDQEAAVVVRNLRVSRLADGDPARAPVYQRP